MSWSFEITTMSDGVIAFLEMLVFSVLASVGAWVALNWFWALMTEFSFWSELRKLPSHSMDIPVDLPPSDCGIRGRQGSATGATANALRSGGMKATGPFAWIVEQGLILRYGRWMVRLAGRILGTLRIARCCCEIDRSYSDRVIIWMQVGPPARPTFWIGVDILRSDANQEQLALLNRWEAEKLEHQDHPSSST